MIERVDLVADTGNTWVGYVRNVIRSGHFRYHLEAVSSSGLGRRTPDYEINSGRSGLPAGGTVFRTLHLSIAPNPFARSTTVRFTLARQCGWELRLYDLPGSLIRTIEGRGAGEQSVRLDQLNLPSGSYRLELRTPWGTEADQLRIMN